MIYFEIYIFLIKLIIEFLYLFKYIFALKRTNFFILKLRDKENKIFLEKLKLYQMNVIYQNNN